MIDHSGSLRMTRTAASNIFGDFTVGAGRINSMQTGNELRRKLIWDIIDEVCGGKTYLSNASKNNRKELIIHNLNFRQH